MNSDQALKHFQNIILRNNNKPSTLTGLNTDELISELFNRVSKEGVIHSYEFELMRLAKLIQQEQVEMYDRQLSDRILIEMEG